MKKRNFLVPLATLAAGLSAEQASALAQPAPQLSVADEPTHNLQVPVAGETITARHGEDQFSFILKRNEQGQFMAWHTSHASHASHSSHASHASHASGY
ncbi:His-Xaa-Ser repeat protein HxsA2 [Pseudomonas schmalbachii]|uniref:Copper-binding protein n=1 Tax=Pseudomonas schmalbachii TaxID=2816993 RepID=A0ABS3TRF3_9PSED|nr:His-Xaa-Ser repeat protein HxsA2 [Pseudomonas schmalbachii]MBO3276245.1 hypothetical protein [Pseudomonas schmalbachii]